MTSGQKSCPPAWPTGSRVLRLREVCLLTGLSKTTIYKLGNEGKFVPSISLGGASVGWPSHLVEAWLAERLQISLEKKLDANNPPHRHRPAEFKIYQGGDRSISDRPCIKLTEKDRLRAAARREIENRKIEREEP
ncbi:AlpA family phage regulatory protein [Aquitalea magnusonii]|uniref:helix-turn-helix transcriptional regulator n=1 Tax=Aquitalea magnusonii TaxID=332411 RepID=UPI0009E88CE7